MELKLLQKTIISEITKPTERDKQANIGPSMLGGCPICVGEKLAEKLPDLYPELYVPDEFGLGSWRGTAIHDYLEKVIDIPGAIKEQKNVIYELEGYGTIKGSTDFFLEPHVIDWKNVGKWSYDKMRLAYKQEPGKIPTQTYRVQQMSYAYGWRKLGYEVETVSLCVIPSHSNSIDDVKFFTEIYNEEVALKGFERLEKIWSYVQDGRLSELPSDGEDCYVCSRVLFRY